VQNEIPDIAISKIFLIRQSYNGSFHVGNKQPSFLVLV